MSTAADQFSSSLVSDIIIFVDHPSDPVNFSSDVAVVGTGVSTDCHKRSTVSNEWTDGWDHNLCLFGYCCELVDIAWISDENWNTFASSINFYHVGFDLIEPLLTSTSDSPFDWSSILSSQVLGCKSSSEPRCSKKHKIILSIFNIFNFI